MNAVDLSQYEHYWSGEEAVPGLDFTQSWTRHTLLEHLQGMLAGIDPLLKRNFKNVQETQTDGASCKVKVMQWNILAQALSTGKDNFVKCPEEALCWRQRRLRILEEILTTDPQVLCLQEVDHFAFFKGALGCLGYEGTFFPKPDSPALYAQDSNGPDGCAMFYKNADVELVKKEAIVLKTAEETKFTNQVCIIMTFRCRGYEGQLSKEFVVATTHLKAKPGWQSLRYSQGQYLLDYLQKEYPGKALIVCGDFNAEMSEPVYKAFDSSLLNLKSAYKLLQGNDEEPEYTTWKIRGSISCDAREIAHTIDYMWYSDSKFIVNSLLDIPDEKDLGENRLPSFSYPSDHLSLAAILEVV